MLQESIGSKRPGQVHIDLGGGLKQESESVLKEMGLSISEAVRIFLRQVVLSREIPFDVRFSADIPNEETRAAMMEVESGKTKKTTRVELRKMWDEA